MTSPVVTYFIGNKSFPLFESMVVQNTLKWQGQTGFSFVSCSYFVS